MGYKMPSRSLFSTSLLATSSSSHLRFAVPVFYRSGGIRVCTRQVPLRSLSSSYSIPFSSSPRALSSYTKPIPKMEVELTAPNGKKWSQPLGLLINGEFVKSSNEQKIATINPS